ncbi:MAG: DUF4270 family protein, partial [Psychroserpens sp.]|nr:DUF4270 family protein [Psychroserpens sp.]
MKYPKIALKNFAMMAILISLFIACDKDFASVESDIVNNENATNFDTDSRVYDLISFTNALPPVQTNNLPLNLLGVYNDPLYGRTTASFVTQLSTSFIEPDFGENAVLDSVVLTIPYFSTATEIDDEGETLFELDSVFGEATFNLSLYESNYFLRDFQPSGDLNDPQVYYSNKSTGSSIISDGILEGTLIRDLSPFFHDNRQIVLKDNEGEITGRQVP